LAIEEVQAAAGERVVVLVGSLQDEAGCGGDWDPACFTTKLEDQGEGMFSATFVLPAGEYEYKVAMDGGWAENYGADGVLDGPNIALSLSEETEVIFTYDDNTYVVTDSVNE
jgi:hypothetical protein